jgi:hypothetical protein
MTMDEKVKQFIEDIIAVYRKHGLAISHQDCQGAFIIEPNKNDYYERWLRNAEIGEIKHDQD